MKLKLTTALTTGTIVLAAIAPSAGIAGNDNDGATIEIQQLNTSDIAADLNVAVTGIDASDPRSQGRGRDDDWREAMDELTATAAAIGNTVSLDGVMAGTDGRGDDRGSYGRDGRDALGGLSVDQKVEGDIAAVVDVTIENVAVDGAVTVSATGIGNAASLVDVTADALSLDQSKEDEVTARLRLEMEDVAFDQDGTNAFSAAAIGNIASLDGIELEGRSDDVTLEQSMDDGRIKAAAKIDIEDVSVDDALGMSVAALGNTLSVTDLEIDSGDLEIGQEVDEARIEADLEFTAEDLNVEGNLDITAVALGNAASFDDVDSDGDLDLTQNIDDTRIEADSFVNLDGLDVHGDVTVSVAAVGNNAAFGADSEFDDITVTQAADSAVGAALDLRIDGDSVNSRWTGGNLAISAAALANSVSIDDVEIEDDLELSQTARDEVAAEAVVRIDDLDVENALAVTVAALGNSMSLSDLEVDDDFDVTQRATDDVSASMELELTDTDIDGERVDEDLAILATSVAALGNSMSIDGLELGRDDLVVEQTMTDDVDASLSAELADVVIRSENDNSGLSLSVAALGNSVNMFDIDTHSTTRVSQTMTDSVTASGRVGLEDVRIENGANITVAAIGNSASVSNDEIDGAKLVQTMSGSKATSTLGVAVDELRFDDLSLKSVAIGNSASYDLPGRYDLEATQTLGEERDGTTVTATLDFGPDWESWNLPNGDLIDASVVAIGNTFAADISDGRETALTQTVYGVDLRGDRGDDSHHRGHEDMAAQISATANVEAGTISDVSVTAAAIGNSFTLEGFGGGVGQSASITQTSYASVSASAKVVAYNPSSVNSTVAAIGNTGAITIKMVDG